ncbi:MAG: carbon monoxide dehydrogenase subunit G [Burkholderiales bacterium]|jgi:carbon monoxide dehydrogenase subunit G|nr:carbon monoxide dehydrogenase subunit G [Burkholderiales bacterium]
MELSSSRFVPAPPQRVWDALNDPETLKACIPGCESFEAQADGSWAATVAAKVGPVSARFRGRIELADVNPPAGYTLRFQGQGGAAGFANGEAKVGLAPAEGGTTLNYSASAQIGGKLAQVGSRLVDGAAAKLADDFFARFVERLAPPAAVAAPAPAPVPAPAPGAGGARWIRFAALAAIVALIAWLAFRGGFRP